jgi:voltage-gated potassium channel
MNPETKSLLLSALGLAIILLVSAAIFQYYENLGIPDGEEKYTFLDTVYWTIVTLSTVGYGDIHPTRMETEVLSIFLIVLGLSIYVYVITQFGSFIVGRSLKEAKGMKKCDYENHVVVLGINDVTEESIRQLLHSDRKVAAVVESSEDVDRTVRLGAFPVLGDPTQPGSLEMANLGKADTVLINLQDDSRTILAALACRKVAKSARIVASIKQRDLIELVRESGVESVISPQSLTGRMLASAVFEPDVIDFVDDVTSGLEGCDLREFPARSPVSGKTVGEALRHLRERTGALLVALVKKEGGKEMTNPPDDMLIEDGDKLILLGYPEQFEKVKGLLGG